MYCFLYVTLYCLVTWLRYVTSGDLIIKVICPGKVWVCRNEVEG